MVFIKFWLTGQRLCEIASSEKCLRGPVDFLINGPVSVGDLFQRHAADLSAIEGYHFPELAPQYQLDRAYAEPRSQHPVISRGGAAPLYVTEHGNARFNLRPLLYLLCDEVP